MKRLFFVVTMFSLSMLRASDGNRDESSKSHYFTAALSAGYVFKHDDCLFKNVYGEGIANILTADGCYYPGDFWGVGAKIGYWLARGRTTVSHRRTHIQEIPITFYLRGRINCRCGLQPYASVGGGVIFIEERSYLGRVSTHKGIGEGEIGMNYVANNGLTIIGAFRYLFPREMVCGQRVDVGGFDIRAGIGFSY